MSEEDRARELRDYSRGCSDQLQDARSERDALQKQIDVIKKLQDQKWTSVRGVLDKKHKVRVCVE